MYLKLKITTFYSIGWLLETCVGGELGEWGLRPPSFEDEDEEWETTDEEDDGNEDDEEE